MTPRELAETFENRILAFLHNVGAKLTQAKIFIDTPRRMWGEGHHAYEWWLLVYPWARVDRPPDNALIIKVRLLIFAGGARAKFLLELEGVDGRWIDELDPEDVVLSDDLDRLSEQVEDFEIPEMVRQIAKRIQAYIAKERRENPKGPREWSPRLKGVEMGAKEKTERPIRINLVEDKGWDPWRSDNDDLNERIQRFSDEYHQLFDRTMEREECESLVEDILGPYYRFGAPEGPREWSPKITPIGIIGVRKACKGIKDGDLEAADYLIRDAIQFMWEEAMTPDDGDIEYALSETKDKFADKPDLDEIWDPLLEKGRKARGVMMDLMNQIHYSRTQGHYDRYLIFDFLNAQSVTDLIQYWPIEDQGWVRDTLEFQDLKDLRERFLEEFFEKLKKVMDDSDPANRADWKKHWRAVLTNNDQVTHVRQQIWNYLRTAPELPEAEE